MIPQRTPYTIFRELWLLLSFFSLTGHAFHAKPSLAQHRTSHLFVTAKIVKSEEEWRSQLSPEAYQVLREEGTEPPNTSPLNLIKGEEGTFVCAGCSSPLFQAETKYESGTGWPSFYSPIDADAVELGVDFKAIAPRTEVRCNACRGHLGHVFDDGPAPTGKRYCLNGVAMDFVTSNDASDEFTKGVMDRVREQGGQKIKEPPMAVVPGIALDSVVAALFINQFIGNTSGKLDSVEGIAIILRFIPLLIGAFYTASALRKLVNLAGLDD